MSFCIEIKDKKGKLKYHEKQVPYFSHKIETSDYICIFSGEFHSTAEKFERFEWEKKQELLLENDSFSVVKIDKQFRKVYFALSKYGLEELFYYYDGVSFVLSDDFWEVANIVCAGRESIDKEAVKEYLNACYPLFDTTFLINVKRVSPAHIGVYDILTRRLEIKQYCDFRYFPDKKATVEGAAYQLNKTLCNTIQKIKDECGDVKYALGLSGGLDSRIIPFYAKKCKMSVYSFIIGDKRPHKILLSGDHRNARKLAKIFGIEHYECKWDRNVFFKTVRFDIKNNPLNPPQFFKGEFDFEFDVLLNGGNGYAVGSTMPANLESLSIQELANELWQLGRDFKATSLKSQHLEKAFSILFHKKINISKEKKWFNLILDEKTKDNILHKFQTYVFDEKSKGKTNLDIYEGYFHNVLGARNKSGGFESLCGTKRSFSIYMPHVLDETLTWPLPFLENRVVLKELIKTFIPDVAEVKEQKYEGTIKKNKKFFLNRFLNICEFIIRGNGTEMVNTKFKKVQDLFVCDMSNSNRWFYDIVPIRPYLKDILRFDNKYALMRIWKCKMVLDYLETGEYKKFVETCPYKDF